MSGFIYPIENIHILILRRSVGSDLFNDFNIEHDGSEETSPTYTFKRYDFLLVTISHFSWVTIPGTLHQACRKSDVCPEGFIP